MPPHSTQSLHFTYLSPFPPHPTYLIPPHSTLPTHSPAIIQVLPVALINIAVLYIHGVLLFPQFCSDFDLIVYNCEVYNGVESDYSLQARLLAKEFYQLIRKHFSEDTSVVVAPPRQGVIRPSKSHKHPAVTVSTRNSQVQTRGSTRNINSKFQILCKKLSIGNKHGEMNRNVKEQREIQRQNGHSNRVQSNDCCHGHGACVSGTLANVHRNNEQSDEEVIVDCRDSESEERVEHTYSNQTKTRASSGTRIEIADSAIDVGSDKYI